MTALTLSSAIPLLVFATALTLIVLDVFEKALIALLGAVLLIVFRILTPEQAIEAINFETIVLLMSMMILVEISRKSGIFAWLNVKLVALTKGNPLYIYLVFSLLTAVLSAFLDNVTTILIVIPITVELFKGLGRDPKPLVFGEIFMSNIGGAMTLIGDPPNIIIGGATGFTFNEFIANLWIPTLASIAVLTLITVALHWKELRPISSHCSKLLLSMMLLRRLQYTFVKMELSRSFILKALIILGLTLSGFALQTQLHMHVHTVALLGAVSLALICGKEACIHETLRAVEWTTLLFFSGLFIMVAGVEHTGLLDQVSHWIVNSTDSFPVILILVLWASGLISMVLDNIPFVTVMIPVIFGIEAKLTGQPHVSLLWWALSLGACIGGNGTIIGASANVIGIDIARKDGVHISFLGYFKYAFPLTCLALLISSAYLLFRYYLT